MSTNAQRRRQRRYAEGLPGMVEAGLLVRRGSQYLRGPSRPSPVRRRFFDDRWPKDPDAQGRRRYPGQNRARMQRRARRVPA